MGLSFRQKINRGRKTMARNVEERLMEAGYQLLGQDQKIEELIISILKEKNTRYLKAIPFLIYLHQPDISIIHAKTREKRLLGEIIGITRKIFQEEKISRELPTWDKKTKLKYGEFKQEFELQRRRQEKPSLLLEKEKFHAERNLQLWLSYIFTKKEREIIEKILNEKQLTKTEYEYYSRKAKKKLNAIMYLQELSRAVVPLSPKFDRK